MEMRKADKAEAKAERARWRAAERRYRAARYAPPPGYVYREWRYGERLPPAYYGPVYRLEYERYGLYAPPPGYVWTRVDDRAVLTAVATGVIAAVVVDLFE
jgi:Ni/Co efflux regulator RcnB